MYNNGIIGLKLSIDFVLSLLMMKSLSLKNMAIMVTAFILNNTVICLLEESRFIDKYVPFDTICLGFSI